jgi:hypothetical protein
MLEGFGKKIIAPTGHDENNLPEVGSPLPVQGKSLRSRPRTHIPAFPSLIWKKNG